jgi:hypothetical protein
MFLIMLCKFDASLLFKTGVLILIIILTGLLILKKGIIVINNRLFTGYFLFGLLISKNEMIFEYMRIITILTFGKRPNYNYPSRWSNFNRWEPNLEYRSSSFQLFFTNEEHTVKKIFLSLTKENSCRKAIDFLLENTTIEIQDYNPTSNQY